LFGLTDRSHFRLCIDDAWNDIVVHMTVLTSKHLCQCNTLVLSLVREHWSLHDIANRINTINTGLELTINLNATTLIEHNTSVFETKTIRIGSATGRD